MNENVKSITIIKQLPELPPELVLMCLEYGGENITYSYLSRYLNIQYKYKNLYKKFVSNLLVEIMYFQYKKSKQYCSFERYYFDNVKSIQELEKLHNIYIKKYPVKNLFLTNMRQIRGNTFLLAGSIIDEYEEMLAKKKKIVRI